MAAKIRILCPHCKNANNVHSVDEICPSCKNPLGISEEGSLYIYRQGSPYGVAGGFGIYLNTVPYGYIGNKELLRIPLKFGTYNIHCAVGMSRRCQDMQVTLTPENPVAYTKVYIKAGFWTNSFVVEPQDPAKLDL